MSRGRPSFKMAAGRLKALRDERGFTQKTMADRLHALRSGKPDATPPASALVSYQRIERVGSTSQQTAERLAIILGTTVAVLQGDTPDEGPAAIDRVEAQLRSQLALGTNQALAAALAREQSDEDPRDPVRVLASDLAWRIEAAQFGRDAVALQRLGEVTGWSEKELRKPLVVDGRFLVLSKVHGGLTTEIVDNAIQARNLIEQTREQYANYRDSDARVVLREDAPWLHVEFHHARRATTRTVFSVVRCEPAPSGLLWSNPTVRDRFWLHERLEPWAYGESNFVQGFDGVEVPADIRRLALVLERVDGPDAKPVSVETFRREVDADYQAILERLVAEGAGHEARMSWLVGDLFDRIAPHLGEWPLSCWKIVGRVRIGFELEVPHRLWRDSATPRPWGVKYWLRLVEELPDGTQRDAPWRHSGVEAAIVSLRRQLDDRVADLGPSAPAR